MAISPDDWVLVQNIVKVAQSNFSITDAKDWPMFLWMLKVVGVVITLVLGLVLYIWQDLKKNITSRRAEDSEKCQNCKSGIWEYIKGPMLNAIMACCYIDDATKIKLMADVKSYAEGSEDHG